MTKSEFIASPNGPFVLFSMGLRGFEGECDRRILATAKLEYPYVYEIRKK